MRCVIAAAVFMILAFAPAFAEEPTIVTPVRIPSVEQLKPPTIELNNQNNPEADITGNVCYFKVVRSRWNDQIRMEAQAIANPRKVEIARIDFSKTKVGIVKPPSMEQKSIEIEFKYEPLHIHEATPVPEPGSIVVFGAGALGLICHWRRHRAIARRQS